MTCEHKDFEAVSPGELVLRRLLWLRHGCQLRELYADDGEMQCGRCLIDFRRLTVEEIAQRFELLGQLRMRAALEEPRP